MKELIKNILKRAGKQIINFPDYDLARRMKLVNHLNIDTLFDVGANDGKYATIMREIGYGEKIISFEPLKSAFEGLKKTSIKDKNWVINNYALGHENINSFINVAANSGSSSILNMLPIHLKNAPDSLYIAKEEITIKKMDTIFSSFVTKENNVMLKIDTQGFEKNVLDGASESLNDIKIIQLEMSLVQLYESELLFNDMIKYLNEKGFQLCSIENGFSDNITYQLLQVDGIFVQKRYL